MRVRVKPGLRGVDRVRVSDDLFIDKNWTEISKTAAKKLVGSQWQGRPMYDFEDGEVDDISPEEPAAEPEEDES